MLAATGWSILYDTDEQAVSRHPAGQFCPSALVPTHLACCRRADVQCAHLPPRRRLHGTISPKDEKRKEKWLPSSQDVSLAFHSPRMVMGDVDCCVESINHYRTQQTPTGELWTFSPIDTMIDTRQFSIIRSGTCLDGNIEVSGPTFFQTYRA